MELFATVILLTFTAALESQLEGPQNAVSVAGSNATLKCLSPSRNCNGIDWIKYSHGNPSTVFTDRRGISISYRARYNIDNNSPGCSLIIENVQLKDAGRFLCRAIVSSNSVEKTAYLIILDTPPKCTTNASMNDTVEEDGVQLSCVETYNGTNRISMVWKGVEDSSTAARNEIGKAMSQSYFVVASAPEVPSFTCITSFAVETKGNNGAPMRNLATNIPNTTCETPIVKVLYSVRNVTLSPSRSYYTSGNVVNCTAKGHPSPTFKWQEMENDGTWTDIQIQNGNEFTMKSVSSKLYRCVAMNFVRGRNYNAISHVFGNTFSDCKDSITVTTMSPLPLNLTPLPSTATVYMRVAVGAAVGFLLLIALLIICFCVRVCPGYKCCHSGNESKDGVMQRMDRQLSAMDPSIPRRTEAPLVGEQESAYACLGENRDVNEYEALKLRQKAKPKETSRP